jgi:hypothetical protein
MKTRVLGVLLILLSLYIGGCATFKPVPLNPQFWQQEGKKVGVVLLTYPPGETIVAVSTINRFAGAREFIYGGMLESPEVDYEPMRYAETRPLREAVEKLDARDFSKAQDIFVQGLKERGFKAFKIERPLVKKDLPRFTGGKNEGPYEDRDFRETGKSSGADYLIVVYLIRYGPYAHYTDFYNDYVEVRVQAQAEMLDMKTNRILWRTGLSQGDFRKSVDATTYRPDETPIIIDAQKKLLSDAASSLASDFFSSQ